MTLTAYLTIDDSPTFDTDDLTDFLVKRNVPAVLYCIGGAYTDLDVQCQGIDQLPQPILNAIDKGFIIGNHTNTHQRASLLSYEEVVAEIETTEKKIDALYKKAGKARPVKLLRFPHLDRGCGGWIVDYDAAGSYAPILIDMFGNGLNISLDKPPQELVEKKEKIRSYLEREGFTADAFTGVTHPWYAKTEMAEAPDSLCTYSTSDWMLNPAFTEHAKNWAYHSVQELKDKIDQDEWLNREDSANVILAHDHNGLFPVVSALVDHMLERGFKFLAPAT